MLCLDGVSTFSADKETMEQLARSWERLASLRERDLEAERDARKAAGNAYGPAVFYAGQVSKPEQNAIVKGFPTSPYFAAATSKATSGNSLLSIRSSRSIVDSFILSPLRFRESKIGGLASLGSSGDGGEARPVLKARTTGLYSGRDFKW
jgi:hypothetical protein